MCDMWLNFIRAEHRELTPESKFIVVRLAHCCAKHESVAGYGVKALSKKFGVSDRTVSMALDWLIKNKYFDRARGNFSEDFTQKCIENEADCVGEYWVKTMEDLLVKRDEIWLLKCTARRMFLIVLLAHADEFGVVSKLSLAKLERILGSFTKDRHRAQVDFFMQKSILHGYHPGFTGKYLFGKQKSAYVVNLHHYLFKNVNEKRHKMAVASLSLDQMEMIGFGINHSIYAPDKKLSRGRGFKFDNLTETWNEDEKEKWSWAIEHSRHFFEGDSIDLRLCQYLFNLAMACEKSGAQDLCPENLLSPAYLKSVCKINGDQKIDTMQESLNHVIKDSSLSAVEKLGSDIDKQLGALGYVLSRLSVSLAERYGKYIPVSGDFSREVFFSAWKGDYRLIVWK